MQQVFTDGQQSLINVFMVTQGRLARSKRKLFDGWEESEEKALICDNREQQVADVDIQLILRIEKWFLLKICGQLIKLLGDYLQKHALEVVFEFLIGLKVVNRHWKR